MNRASSPVRNGTALVLGYEAMALVSGGRLPTITRLCGRHRWLSAVAVLGLVVHLAMYPQEIMLLSDLNTD